MPASPTCACGTRDVAALRDAYRVIRYDTRGYGRTETDAVEFSNRADIAALLDHLGEESAHVVGFSRAGQIALDFALEYPDRVRSLVVGAGGIGGYESPDEAPAETFEAAEKLWEAKDWAALSEWEAAYWADGPGQPADRVPEVRAKVHDWVLTNYLAEKEEGKPQVLDPPAAGRLGELKAPLLVIIGTFDDPGTQESMRHLAEARSARTARGLRGRRAHAQPRAAGALRRAAPRVPRRGFCPGPVESRGERDRRHPARRPPPLARVASVSRLRPSCRSEARPTADPAPGCSFPEHGAPVGLISGGCLEEEAARLAREALTLDAPVLVTVDHSAEGDELWGLGLGCRGVIDLLAEPPDMAAETLAALAAARDGTATYLLTGLDGERRRLSAHEADALGERAVLAVAHGRPMVLGDAVLDPILPPLHLVICGAGPDAGPLAEAGVAPGLAGQRRRSAQVVPAAGALSRRHAPRRRAGLGRRCRRRRRVDGSRRS